MRLAADMPTRMDETAPTGLRLQVRQQAPIPLDAEFSCAPGEVLALVGPSGSGKTTLLRSIAGLYQPRQGSIHCNGEAWFDTARKIHRAPQRRSVGLVFQNYALFPHLTALANIVAAMDHLPPALRERRARELLELVHLAGLASRYPQALSGGQQQRVAVARALGRDPKVLLLDEPFSAVDRVTRHKLYRELAELRRQLHIPVVLVTHDLDEAAMLCDRMCILHRGVTLQSGPPFAVMARPQDASVARLVDVKNIFEGRILRHLPERAMTLLAWLDYTLETPLHEAIPEGTPVCWMIPTANVILHRRDRPSRGEHENPVKGVIIEFIPLGENTSVTVQVGNAARLSMSVPTHVANRNRLKAGESVAVSLLAEAIHLMPWQSLKD